MPKNCSWITPQWPAPRQVKALTTVRQGGYSIAPYDSFNLALHVGDDPKAVLANRELLKLKANVPNEPCWLTQVHSTNVVELSTVNSFPVEADASVTFQLNQICVVLSGDCLPILWCNKKGTCVGAIHAGWKGLAAGIIETALTHITDNPENLLVWLGPAIGPTVYEVREDVFLAFTGYHSHATFRATENKGVWFANLYQLAKERLQQLGVHNVFGGEYCTYQDTTHFYSARRSKITGRMASLIWLTPT